MVNLFENLSVIGKHYGPADDEAWERGDCPNCGPVQFGCAGFISDSSVAFLRCISCGIGVVRNYDQWAPSRKPLGLPLGLPEDVEVAWDEVRSCLGVGAYTASVMLCRKLLLNLAVNHGLPARDQQDRAPSFIACVDHLEQEGVITKRMRPWVDRVKDVGNQANHELEPIPRDEAFDVAEFMEQILKLAYELDHRMAQSGDKGD